MVNNLFVSLFTNFIMQLGQRITDDLDLSYSVQIYIEIIIIPNQLDSFFSLFPFFTLASMVKLLHALLLLATTVSC